MKRGPDFLIIGAMKCATSTLHEQLGRQPGCFTSRPKELCFFSDDDRFARGIDWYRSCFDAAPDGALCGESSTDYTKLPTHPGTAERIRAHLPQAKLVYLMRHPLDRLVSHYIHEWSQARIRLPLARALDRHPELVDYGRYAMQLRPYLEAFGPAQVLPVFFEQQVADPQGSLERVCRFLGLPEKPAWDFELGAQNVSRERLRVSPLRDALVEAPLLRALRRRWVPQGVRDRVKSWWTIGRRPEIPAARRAELEAVFDADLGELGRWLGRELSCARFAALADEAPPRWTREAPGSAA